MYFSLKSPICCSFDRVDFDAETRLFVRPQLPVVEVVSLSSGTAILRSAVDQFHNRGTRSREAAVHHRRFGDRTGEVRNHADIMRLAHRGNFHEFA